MKTYEDEAFDDIDKAQQRKVATGVTDGSIRGCMTQDEIVEMAAQTKLGSKAYFGFVIYQASGTKELEAFAKLVEERTAAKEREACAELRKTLSAVPNRHVPQLQPAVESTLDFYAERIRARGQA